MASPMIKDCHEAGVYVKARIHNSQFKVALKRLRATLSSNCGNQNETLRFEFDCGSEQTFLIGAIFQGET